MNEALEILKHVKHLVERDSHNHSTVSVPVPDRIRASVTAITPHLTQVAPATTLVKATLNFW